MPWVTTTYNTLPVLTATHYNCLPCQCTTCYCRRDTLWPAVLLLVVLLGGGLDGVVGSEVVPGVGPTV